MNANDPQTIKQLLSELADGELNNSDTNEAIDLACQDQEVRYAWQSTHLVRDVMQADYHSALAPDFSARVSASIAKEPAHEEFAPVASISQARGQREERIRGARPVRRASGSAPVTSMQQPFVLWKPVAGLGLAASLAGATFLFSQLWQSEQADSGQLAQAEQTTTTAPNAVASTESVQDLDDLTLQAAVKIGNSGTRWRMGSEEAPRNEEIEERLNTLLTNHLQDASMGRVNGLISHSRVVGYDTVPDEQQASE